MAANKNIDIVDCIIRWEGGEMSNEETTEFFQALIDSGDCWSLQGCYGRQAVALLQAGYCHVPEQPGRARQMAEHFMRTR